VDLYTLFRTDLLTFIGSLRVVGAIKFNMGTSSLALHAKYNWRYTKTFLSVFLALDSIHAERAITYAITRPSSVRHTDKSVEVAVDVMIMQY